ncbi:hypothetical protein Tco_0600691 [Tanacetum coccineum]
MEQDPQMDHDQTNEPSGPHETHDEDETGQINDEGQPNNDEFETNESNEGAEAQAEQDPLEQELNHQDSKIMLYKFPLRSNTRHQHPIRLPPRVSNKLHKMLDGVKAMQKEVKALEKNGSWTLEYLPEGKRAID